MISNCPVSGQIHVDLTKFFTTVTSPTQKCMQTYEKPRITLTLPIKIQVSMDRISVSSKHKSEGTMECFIDIINFNTSLQRAQQQLWI